MTKTDTCRVLPFFQGLILLADPHFATTYTATQGSVAILLNQNVDLSYDHEIVMVRYS